MSDGGIMEIQMFLGDFLWYLHRISIAKLYIHIHIIYIYMHVCICIGIYVIMHIHMMYADQSNDLDDLGLVLKSWIFNSEK